MHKIIKPKTINGSTNKQKKAPTTKNLKLVQLYWIESILIIFPLQSVYVYYFFIIIIFHHVWQHFVGVMGQKSYQARWVNWESTEQATTSVLMAWNSCTRSLNAMISVGQTNVLQTEEQQGGYYAAAEILPLSWSNCDMMWVPDVTHKSRG